MSCEFNLGWEQPHPLILATLITKTGLICFPCSICPLSFSFALNSHRLCKLHEQDIINKTWPQILISWNQFKTWPQNLISWHQFKTWPQNLISWHQFKTWPQKLIKWHQFKTWPQKLIKWHQKLIKWHQLLISWHQFISWHQKLIRYLKLGSTGLYWAVQSYI